MATPAADKFLFNLNRRIGRRLAPSLIFALVLSAGMWESRAGAVSKFAAPPAQDQNSIANRLLPILGSASGVAIAHGAALGETGRSPKQRHQRERSQAQLHRAPTPRCSSRNASAKKIHIKDKQTTSDAIVNHFIVDTSYFICMK